MDKIRDSNYIEKIFIYLYLFFAILQANSIYLTHGGIGHFIKPITQLLLISLLFIELSQLHAKISNRLLIFIILFVPLTSLFFVIEYIKYKFLVETFFRMIMDPTILVICFYCFYARHNINYLLYKYENVILVLSVVSLIFWMMAVIGVPTNMSTVIKFGTARNFSFTGLRNIPGYFNLDFIAQGKNHFLGMDLIRNTGIFAEAPVFSSLLTFAALIELFLRKKKRVFNKRMIILCISLFTTASTNGLFIMLPAFIIYELLFKARNSLFIDVLLPILCLIALIVLQSALADKTSINSFNSSYNLRINDYIVAFKAWTNHYFFGNGIGNYLSVIPYMSAERVAGGNGIIAMSNGIMTILDYGGILLELYYLIPLVGVIRKAKNVMAFSVFLLLLFALEDVSGFYIFIMILAYLWTIIILGNSSKKYFRKNIKEI